MNPGTGQGQKLAFTTTHWTVVLTAGQAESPHADSALESLCRSYWYPLYAFIRRRGHEAHEAQDLTQEFFARLLQKDYLRDVDPKKGRFRSFLLAALEHFLANEWRRGKAQKRGGNVQFISLDDSAEQHYSQTPASGLSAEKFYAQQWATTMLEKVLNRLKDEFSAAGKGPLFDHLKVFLTETRPIAYAELASALNTTEPALKMAVTRLRQRYAELLREEIAGTVSGPTEIDQELRELFAALSP
jgi:RNA polymerase sigma-70 factor (ECF subfamily)